MYTIGLLVIYETGSISWRTLIVVVIVRALAITLLEGACLRARRYARCSSDFNRLLAVLCLLESTYSSYGRTGNKGIDRVNEKYQKFKLQCYVISKL